MLLLIPLLPLVGFLINASLGRRISKPASGAVACGAIGASFLVALTSVWRLVSMPVESRAIVDQVFTWITSGRFTAAFTLRLDPLSSVMILVITGIGSLIHIYSTAYMHEETDAEYARYFSYLNLFAAFMLVLVLGSNFLVMFVGWEGVGLCSYLLIGFWYQKKSGVGRRQESLHRQPHRRLRIPARRPADLRPLRHDRLPGSRARGGDARARSGVRHGLADHAAAVRRRHRQVGADSALRLAAGRDGRPDAGLGAHPCGDDGDGGRVHDWPQRRAVQPRAARR